MTILTIPTTIDRSYSNNIDYEHFNAVTTQVSIFGKSVHPGNAKGKMINTSLIEMEFHQLLPIFDKPIYTSNYEWFNHLTQIIGNCETLNQLIY